MIASNPGIDERPGMAEPNPVRFRVGEQAVQQEDRKALT